MECTTIKIVLWVLNIILFIVLIRRSGLTLSGIHEDVSSRLNLVMSFTKRICKQYQKVRAIK